MNHQHSSGARRMETVNQVGERIGRSKSWIHAAIQRGEFPAGIRLSSRCTRWDSFAVDRWIAEQFEGKAKK